MNIGNWIAKAFVNQENSRLPSTGEDHAMNQRIVSAVMLLGLLTGHVIAAEPAA